jgi:hypothetical protein
MSTRRTKIRRNKTRKIRGGKKSKSIKRTKTGKKWTTAIDAASSTLEKTGSITAAQKILKKQALFNARKMFGSVGNL